MNAAVGRTTKRVVLEGLGWLLVLAGVGMIFLPGPGLLGLFAGLLLLSQQYEWAERWLEPVKLRALREAARGVQSPASLAVSVTGVVLVFAAGALWLLAPTAPSWWPLADSWWLPGGLAVGVTQVVSGLIAAALIVYSYRRFHGDPQAVAELEGDISQADEEQPDLR